MWITNWWFTYHHPARPPLTSQRFQGFPPPWRPPKAASRRALPRPRRPRCHRRRPRRASRRSRRPQPNARRCAQKWCSRDDHHGYQWRSVRKTLGKMVVLKFGKTHGSDWCDGVEHRSNMVMPTGFGFMSCTLTGCYVDDGVRLGGGNCSTWTSAFDLENRQNATISMLWKLALMSVQSVNRNQVTLGVLAKKTWLKWTIRNSDVWISWILVKYDTSVWQGMPCDFFDVNTLVSGLPRCLWAYMDQKKFLGNSEMAVDTTEITNTSMLPRSHFLHPWNMTW